MRRGKKRTRRRDRGGQGMKEEGRRKRGPRAEERDGAVGVYEGYVESVFG